MLAHMNRQKVIILISVEHDFNYLECLRVFCITYFRNLRVLKWGWKVFSWL